MGFGGNNGLTDFKDILGFNVQAATTRAGAVCASARACARRVHHLRPSSLEIRQVLIAVRDAESRTRFLGWRAENVKLFAFTVSAMMAGIAGALYVPQVGIINPAEFEPATPSRWSSGRPSAAAPRIVGADRRGGAGQYRQVLVHRRAAGILAVCAGRVVRRRHAVPAQGHRRDVGPSALARKRRRRRAARAVDEEPREVVRGREGRRGTPPGPRPQPAE